MWGSGAQGSGISQSREGRITYRGGFRLTGRDLWQEREIPLITA